MNRFKECREASGLSQKYVAITLGVAAPSVCNWERGKNEPTKENIIKLAELYGVSVNYLLGIDNGEQKPRVVREKLTDDERALIADYRKLDDRHKIAVRGFATQQLDNQLIARGLDARKGNVG